MQRRPLARIASLVLVAVLAAPQWLMAAVEPQLPDPGKVSGYSKQQQEQLGLKAMAEVYKQLPVLPDSSPITQYVQQLGNKLAGVIPPQYSWPYQFHVVPQKEINAFALPGGPIFINVGTITSAENEAQLVGVMAHEMSHVYMQHSAKQAKKEAVPGAVAGILGGILGSYGGALGQLAGAGIQIGTGAVFMKYSRADEAQADAVGAVIMHKAGYNPQAMADFFKKLEQEGGSGGPQFLSDHPNPGNREAAIQKEIAEWPRQDSLGNTARFQQIRDVAKGTRVYTAQEIAQGAKQGIWARENQRNGVVPTSVATSTPSQQAEGGAPANLPVMNPLPAQQLKSSDLKVLQQPGYRISYPSNWTVNSSNQSQGVTIAPQGGTSQDAVAYGVAIGQLSPPPGTNATPDQLANAVIQAIAQQNGSQPVAEPQDVSVNQVNGRSVNLMGTSPVKRNGKRDQEHDWLVVLPRSDGSVLYLVFVSPEQDFNQLKPTFEKMLRSLRLQ